MKNIIVITLLVAACLFSGCAETKSPQPDGAIIIRTFSENLLSVQEYSGKVTINPGNPKLSSESYSIFIRYPDNFRIEYTDSKSRHKGSVSILNGNTLIEYDPVNNETMILETDPYANSCTSHDYLGLLRQIIPENTIRYAGTDHIPGQQHYILEIIPQNGTTFNQKYSEYQFSLVRVWVSPGSWAVKKIDLVDTKTNQRIVTADYKELLVNEGLRDDLFSSSQYLQYRTIVAPTHPPVVMYPGVDYPLVQGKETEEPGNTRLGSD